MAFSKEKTEYNLRHLGLLHGLKIPHNQRQHSDSHIMTNGREFLWKGVLMHECIPSIANNFKTSHKKTNRYDRRQNLSRNGLW